MSPSLTDQNSTPVPDWLVNAQSTRGQTPRLLREDSSRVLLLLGFQTPKDLDSFPVLLYRVQTLLDCTRVCTPPRVQTTLVTSQEVPDFSRPPSGTRSLLSSTPPSWVRKRLSTPRRPRVCPASARSSDPHKPQAVLGQCCPRPRLPRPVPTPSLSHSVSDPSRAHPSRPTSSGAAAPGQGADAPAPRLRPCRALAALLREPGAGPGREWTSWWRCSMLKGNEKTTGALNLGDISSDHRCGPTTHNYPPPPYSLRRLRRLRGRPPPVSHAWP